MVCVDSHGIHAGGMRQVKGFIIVPMYLALAAIAVLVITNVITFKLYRSAEHELFNFKAQVAAAQEQVRIEAERKQAEAERLVAEVSKSWSDALEYARAHPRVVRVLQSAGCGGTGQETASTVQGTDEASATGQLGATIDAAKCEVIANMGIVDAAHVLHLQAYINGLCNTYGCD